MTTGPDQAHLRRQGCRFVAMPNDNVKLNVEQNRVLKQLATLRAVAAASEARAKSLVGSTQHHAGLLQSSLKRLNTWQPDIVPQNDAAWLRDMAAELWLVASLAESAASTLVESAEADLAASRAGEGKALERVVEVCDERDTARAEYERLRADKGDMERERGEINRALAAEMEEAKRLRAALEACANDGCSR